MEAMFTTEESTFNTSFLKSSKASADSVPRSNAYAYLQARFLLPLSLNTIVLYLTPLVSCGWEQVGETLLRSQLDCYDPNMPEEKVFDIKSRATGTHPAIKQTPRLTASPITASIRWNLSEYTEYTDVKLQRLRGTITSSSSALLLNYYSLIYNWALSLKGNSSSYESEYYDMARSMFLKNSLQVRIGRMSGIFVAYHNTEELFGFEYISRKELDRVVYGSSAYADRSFEVFPPPPPPSLSL